MLKKIRFWKENRVHSTFHDEIKKEEYKIELEKKLPDNDLRNFDPCNINHVILLEKITLVGVSSVVNTDDPDKLIESIYNETDIQLMYDFEPIELSLNSEELDLVLQSLKESKSDASNIVEKIEKITS